MTLENRRWATVKEAADHFGITRQRVHQLIKKGFLGETKKVDTPRGSVWLVQYPFRRFPTASGGQTKNMNQENRRRRSDGGL